MPRRFILVLGLLLLPQAMAAEEIIEGIAAQVGGEIVLLSEVNRASAEGEARLRELDAPAEEFARLREEVLDHMIDRALIRQVVQRAELGASDIEVDQAIAGIAAENDLTPDQIRQSVEAQGMSYEIYREKIRTEIEYSKVMNGMVASRVRIEEAEVEALYQEQLGDQPTGGDEFYLRHILVTFASQTPAAHQAACGSVEAARGRVLAGEDFNVVASEVSESNPELGGNLGWIQQRDLAAWMAPTVLEMNSGDLSNVIETAFGCNLLQVFERRAYEPVTYEEAYEVLSQRIFSERLAEEYLGFINDVREQTYIERKGEFSGGGTDPVAAVGDS
jgi:peptidyl-prolyl cis-trans isomerase SurA